MTRLVLTSSDSAGVCLLGAGIGDIVIPLGFQFVWGALPSEAKLEQMLGPGSLAHFPQHRLGGFDPNEVGPLELCERCEATELWFDPPPNAQLMLVQLLDYLSAHESIVPKLTLLQADVDIAEQSPRTIFRWKLSAVKIRNEHLQLASMAWRAYRQPTPRHWAQLLDHDVSVLPQLRQTVQDLLEELPMPATGLGATEMRILAMIAAGATRLDLFPDFQDRNRRYPFGYWETAVLLEGLTGGPSPAVVGLVAAPLTEEMHADKRRQVRRKHGKLSLTALGGAVLAGTDDFSRHNPIHRWWGGTELTNDNLWRWDAVNRKLIAP